MRRTTICLLLCLILSALGCQDHAPSQASRGTPPEEEFDADGNIIWLAEDLRDESFLADHKPRYTELVEPPRWAERDIPFPELPQNVAGVSDEVIQEVAAALREQETIPAPWRGEFVAAVPGSFSYDSLPIDKLSKTGKFLASRSPGNEWTVWDLEARRAILRVRTQQDPAFHKNKVGPFGFSNDERYIAVAGHRPGVRIHEIASGKLIFEHKKPASLIRSLEISADDRFILIYERDGKLSRHPLLGGRGRVSDLTVLAPNIKSSTECRFAISPDGMTHLATGVVPKQSLLINFNGLVDSQPRDFQWWQINHPYAVGISDQMIFELGSGSMHLVRRFEEASEFKSTGAWAISSDDTTATISKDSSFIMWAGRIGLGRLDPRNEVRPRWIGLPGMAGSGFSISAEGNFVCIRGQKQALEVYRMSTPEPSPEAKFTQLVEKYLAAEQYEHLEAIGAILEWDQSPCQWDPARERYEAYIGTFTNPMRLDGSVSNTSRVDRWLLAKPESRVARVIRATMHVNTAGAARGDGVAHTVTEQGWREFGSELSKAAALLEPMRDNGNLPPAGYAKLLMVAKGLNWSHDDILELIAEANDVAPWYDQIHHEATQILLPRWHGFPGDGAKYLDAVTSRMNKDDGDILYFRVGSTMLRMGRNEEILGQENYDIKRMMAGVRAILRRCPLAPDALQGGLYLAWRIDDHMAMLEFGELVSRYQVPYYYGRWQDYDFYQQVTTHYVPM